MEELPFDHLSFRIFKPVLDRLAHHYECAARDPVATSNEQLQNLRVYLREVRDSSPVLAHYFALLDDTDPDLSEKWKALPSLGRPFVEAFRKVRRNPHSQFFQAYSERTSGSTGAPFQIFRSAHAQQREMIRLRYVLRRAEQAHDLPPISRILYLSHYPGASSYRHTDLTRGPLDFVKRSFGATERALDALDGAGVRAPYALAGTPSTLARLFDDARRDIGERLDGIQLVLASGEALPAGLKHALEIAAKCPVVELYVMREFGLLAFECSAGRGYHVFDTDFCVHADPARQLLVTDLTNTLDLFVNYGTADYGDITSVAPCPCGEVGTLLSDFRGRDFGKPISAAAI